MWGEVLAVVAGIALLAAGFWRRAVVLRRTRADLERALADCDPMVRCAAVRFAVDQGLRRHAGLLLAYIADEADAGVRQALVDGVRHSAWEPADRPEVVQLGLWARREQWRLQQQEASQRGKVAATPVADAGDRHVVIVTGVGGPAGVAVARALTGRVRVIGVDCDSTAAGQGLVDEFAVLPAADDPDLVPQLVKLVQRVRATALMCTVTEEIGALHTGSGLLEEAGLAMWLPPVDSVRDCADKWRFARLCRTHAIPAPPTALGTAESVPGPWIIKPRFGRGSRDVFAADSVEELDWALARVPDPIVQSRLTGREFTVDALVDRDSSLAGAVPRWRLETKAGISTKGQTFAHPRLVAHVAQLLSALRIQGPVNVQGFLAEDGAISFTEVNPRFSGGLPLSLAAGADLVGEYLRGIHGLALRPERLTAQPNVTMYRYHAEVFVE
jgi:carbamoyl-phosphate synthase large subunit